MLVVLINYIYLWLPLLEFVIWRGRLSSTVLLWFICISNATLYFTAQKFSQLLYVISFFVSMFFALMPFECVSIRLLAALPLSSGI